MCRHLLYTGTIGIAAIANFAGIAIYNQTGSIRIARCTNARKVQRAFALMQLGTLTFQKGKADPFHFGKESAIFFWGYLTAPSLVCRAFCGLKMIPQNVSFPEVMRSPLVRSKSMMASPETLRRIFSPRRNRVLPNTTPVSR